ncbi:MAG: hypothetical protein ACI4NM_11735 [Bullifex sp.]
MRRKAILTIIVLLLMVPVFAGINVSISAGADFSHNLLYEEDILFRTSGRFSLSGDFFHPESNASVAAQPYMKLSFLTDTMTYNQARTLGSFSGSAGLKIRIPAADDLAVIISAGAGAGIYRNWIISAGHGDRNDSLIYFGLAEAGLGIEKTVSCMVFSASLGGEYRKDSIRWHVSAGVGVLI